MDSERFDQLTRRLARGGSRRTFFKAVAGAALGAVGFTRAGAGGVPEIELGHECLETAPEQCVSDVCCPAGSPRGGLCGVPTGGTCGTNNHCCSGSCVEGTCRDRSAGTQGVVCDVGDQADCADGFTCCDNYSTTGPDFYCTDTSTDPINCGGCSETGGTVCASTEVCLGGACVCAPGYVVSPVSGECIPEGTCPSGSAEECGGAQQVCCGLETDKPGLCVGKGANACYRGKSR